MGIPRFYSEWLRTQNRSDIITRSLPDQVSSLSIDANGLIHRAAQMVYAYGSFDNADRRALIAKMNPLQLRESFFQTFTGLLGQVIAGVMPRNLLVIAIDGVAPLAKINQQRARRFRSAQLAKTSSRLFDSNSLTPGTELMDELDLRLQNWLRLQRSYLPPVVIYSSHLEPGEGEHKILRLMRTSGYYQEAMGAGRSQAGLIDQSLGINLLYGLDADLIMLSLLSPLNRMVVARESLSDYINIDSLKSFLVGQLRRTTAVADFVVMMFLAGNDFLPSLSMFHDLGVSFEVMLAAYQQLSGALTTDEGINWPQMLTFLQLLGNQEEEQLTLFSQRPNKHPDPVLQAAVHQTTIVGKSQGSQAPPVEVKADLDYPAYRLGWYQRALTPRNDLYGQLWSSMTGLSQANYHQVEMAELQTLVWSYLQGLAWVFDYYFKGLDQVDATWWYPYLYAPLVRDAAGLLLDTLEQQTPDLGPANPTYLNPYHQLMMVLPLSSGNLLPEALQAYLLPGSPLMDLYPLDFIFDQAGHDNDWQGLVVLPPLQPDRILNIVVPPKPFVAAISLIATEQDRNLYLEVYRRFLEGQRNTRQRTVGARRGRGSRGRGSRGRGRDSQGSTQPSWSDPKYLR